MVAPIVMERATMVSTAAPSLNKSAAETTAPVICTIPNRVRTIAQTGTAGGLTEGCIVALTKPWRGVSAPPEFRPVRTLPNEVWPRLSGRV